jgi:hypothetical protein
MDEISYLTSSGRLLRFLNPPGLYPVNAYQSLVLVAASEMSVLAMAVRQKRLLADLSAWEPCCGGGPVATTLKSLGVGFVQASDVNPLSVASCCENAIQNGLVLERACVADFLDDGTDRRFDLICCNPPCGVGPVVAGTQARLLEAIDGGDDGMEPTLSLLLKAPQRLAPSGSLIIIAVSTGNIVRLAHVLNTEFPNRWRVLPSTPVAAPWLPAADPRVAQLRRGAEEFEPMTWSRNDGWVWRLSWVIEVTAGTTFASASDMPPATGLPLRPFGYDLDQDPGLRALINRTGSDGFWLATQ